MSSMDIKIEECRESDLAKALSITRKAIVEIRKNVLKPEIDWYKEQTKAPDSLKPVWYTKAGMLKIAQHFGIPTEEVSKKNISAANAAPSTLVSVKTIFLRNTRMIEVIHNGEPKKMRVKDATKWMVGMVVEARSEGNNSTFMVPLKNPRYRGKF